MQMHNSEFIEIPIGPFWLRQFKTTYSYELREISKHFTICCRENCLNVCNFSFNTLPQYFLPGDPIRKIPSRVYLKKKQHTGKRKIENSQNYAIDRCKLFCRISSRSI